MSNSSFSFNGIDLGAYGLRLRTRDEIFSQDTELSQLLDRSYPSSSVRPGAPKNLDVVITAANFATLRSNIDSIKAALNSRIDCILTIDSITDRYWLARFASMNRTTKGTSRTWEGTISFTAHDPPAYANSATSYDVPREVVTNGGFATVTTGWTAVNGTQAIVAGGQSGNCLEVTQTSASTAYSKQVITVKTGVTYKYSIYHKNGTGTGGYFGQGIIKLGTSDTGGQYYNSGVLNEADWTLHEGSFVAASDTLYVDLLTYGDNANSSKFDTISILEVVESFTITAGGTEKAKPVITLTADDTLTATTVEIENGATGESFQWTGDLVAADVLVIDCATGQVTLNSVAYIAGMDGQFIQLLPGANAITITGFSGTLNFNYRARYV
jgi:phage-related protein